MIDSLGPCCICETYVGVQTIVMLARRAPIAGHGWGCAQCGLPSDGAVAVVCDGCFALIEAGATPIYVCKGYPGSEGRVPFTDLAPEPFDHDPAGHPEERPQ